MKSENGVTENLKEGEHDEQEDIIDYQMNVQDVTRICVENLKRRTGFRR